MSDRYATVELYASPGTRTDPAPMEIEERPFTIVVLGDFSGRASRAAPGQELSDLRPIAVDRDDFDDVLGRIRPRLRLERRGAAFEIEFGELDDFHPDRLYEQAQLFRELRRVRARAADVATFPALAAELGQGSSPAAPRRTTRSGAVLDQILDEAEPLAAPIEALESRAGLESYVRQLVASHLVANADPRQADVLARLDTAVSEEMRALLHHPSFQALESLWRALFLLVRRLETGPLLRIYLMDLTRAELESSLESEIGGPGSALAGVDPSLIVVAESFGASTADLEALRRLAELGATLDAPVLAGAAGALVGCPAAGAELEDWSPAAAGWGALRRDPAAPFLGLAFPRFLLRIPYGADGDECDHFHFEESPDHEGYLWGNPAFACALLLGQSFSAAGWAMRPGLVREVQGLPVHLQRVDGDATMKPCAEAWMTERTADRLLDLGVMPLASIRDRDAVQLVRFQSVAIPATGLAGRWNR